jgi:SPP1 gp7 family putative phage head morphogenesis protein
VNVDVEQLLEDAVPRAAREGAADAAAAPLRRRPACGASEGPRRARDVATPASSRGRLYTDAIADSARDSRGDAAASGRPALLSEIQAASSYDDLKARIIERVPRHVAGQLRSSSRRRRSSRSSTAGTGSFRRRDVQPVRLDAGAADTVAPPAPTAVDFDEAIGWFRDRVPMTRADWDQMGATARRKAFTVAGVAQLDLVAETHKAIDRAVANGTTLEDFKKEIGGKLESAWGGTVADPGNRLETIFRNGTQTAYNSGRYLQATSEPVLRRRPYWRFVSILDARTSDICRPLDGKVVAASDPWWRSHLAPLHHRCRSTFETLTEAQAKRAGIDADPPKVKAQEGFGHDPTVEWAPDPGKYTAEQREAAAKKGLPMGTGAAGGGGKTPPPAPPAAPAGPGRSDGRQPQGTPVSAALAVKKGAASADIEVAKKAIDATHGDGALPQTPVKTNRKGKNKPGEGEQGKYQWNPVTQAPHSIEVSKYASGRAHTMCHETGHLLDHQVLGTPGDFASVSHPRLADWRAAVQASAAHGQLQNLLVNRRFQVVDPKGRPVTVVVEPTHVRYLLDPRELWARSYAQYVTLRSGDAQLTRELDEMRRPGVVVYPSQWVDADFAPIAEAIDRLFEDLGWLTKAPTSP